MLALGVAPAGAASDKPLIIGLTTDDSGQYGNSGGSERRVS